MQSLEPIDAELLSAFARTVRANIRRELADEAAQAESLRLRVVALVEQAVAEVRSQGIDLRAWLFGSFAWGKPGERSDIDILVDGPALDELAWQIGRKCERMVHAVALGTAPASLRDRVLADGKPL
jgi:hypothetical protein